jgi:phosphofructokinase-like protein
MMNKRIGVMTGGGDCPGLNAVLRAVVKTATRKYGWEVIGFKDGYRGLITNDYLELKPQSVSGIIERGGTILGTSNRDNPFKFRVETDGIVQYVDKSDQVIQNLKNLNIEALVVIGGDGTLSSGRDFAARGVRVIGVPKTIDNDLNATDLTFGFMTAVDTATEAIDRLHTTAESHHRVMVLEVMGRYAGWIALHAGIAGGADVILIPEIPFNIAKVVEKINDRKKNGKNFSIVVVAEGARGEHEELTVQKVLKDSPDPLRLGGIGQKIAAWLEDKTGNETRYTILGHLQRGGHPIPFDRILSTRYGAAAVEFIAAGKEGVMVSLQGSHITSVSLKTAVGNLKTVPPDDEMIEVARGIGIEFGN